MDIKTLLKNLVHYGGSDLHLLVNREPQIRINGELRSLNIDKLSHKNIENITYPMLSEKQKNIFEEYNELDFAFVLISIGRFRANYYKTLGNIGAAFRMIPTIIPSLDELKLPLVYKDFAKKEKGLIIVSGATGSGKSTTLSAIINEININEHKHIITIEDPIEFLHEHKKSTFSFREIGSDTKSFATGLKYAMRQDPDVILIGEMRDKETIEAALTASETGHLVLGTLHSSSAAGTIDRIIDVFSGEEQAQIRTMVSSSLIASIAQTLVPKIQEGRVLANEILINNHAVSNLIRENKRHQIQSQMQLGQTKTGMTTQTQSLVTLVESSTISTDTALKYANNLNEVKSQLLGH